jgi:Fe-S cluster assembly protein SufD
MTPVATHPYIEMLLSGSREPRAGAGGAGWLERIRASALERANALSLPTTRDEEWRFTDITPLTRLKFQSAGGGSRPMADALEPYVVPEAQARLTFVDGVFAPELSQPAAAESGITVSTLAALLKSAPASVEPHLARVAAFDDNVFAAINTAHLRDGALITVAAHHVSTRPVHLLFIATRADIAVYPRCLVVAEAGAQCTLIEDYVSRTEGAYLTNAVTEVVLGPAARVCHIKIQRESREAFHIATCAAALAKDAHYASHMVALGARISRQDLNVLQRGEGVSTHIDGLALISGRQLADTHTLLDHAHPNGRSVQLHKTIVGGAAHAVFSGKVRVHKGAQLTDSAQQSRNLLLSDRAHVDTKPQLEIFADDVKCAHGATVGQLDPEQVFYLKSRGLSEERARALLTYAFGAEIIARIPVRSAAAQLERAVLEQTQHAA